MAKVKKETSPKVAKKASEVLGDDRHSAKVKSVAASDLSQAEGNSSSKSTKKSSGKKGK
ncbi:MAG: hypothetical protein WKF74_14950 [Pyrinomonadaceae bacterium]